MSQELLLDLGFLTEEERDIINGVIFKDVEMRKQEQSRISNLRNELDQLKENGLPDEDIEVKNERYCARCQTYFGVILNTGALCPRCELRVCKKCRDDVDDGDWICTLCFKVKQVKAQSGAWFFQGHKGKNGNLFGSLLVRKSLRRLPALPPGQSGQGNEETRQSNQDAVSNTTSAAVNHDQQYHDDSDQYESIDDVRKALPNKYDTIQQLSDASDVGSDEGDREGRGTPEYHSTGTGSDRSHSRGGGSDSSESLESDEEYRRRKKLSRYSQESMEVAEETTDVETVEEKQRNKALKEHSDVKQREDTESKVGTFEDTQLVPDRPVSLDSTDISYFPAPKFNISSKRRQFSDSDDPTLDLREPNNVAASREPEAISRELKAQSREPEALSRELEPQSRESEPQLQELEAQSTYRSSSSDSNPSQSGRNSNFLDPTEEESLECIDADDEARKVDITEVFDELFTEKKEVLSPVLSDVDEASETSEKAAYHQTKQTPSIEEEICEENEAVVESSSGDLLESYEEDTMEADRESDISENFEESTSHPVDDDSIPRKISQDDEGDIEMMSVFARVKNWERMGDGFEQSFGSPTGALQGLLMPDETEDVEIAPDIREDDQRRERAASNNHERTELSVELCDDTPSVLEHEPSSDDTPSVLEHEPSSDDTPSVLEHEPSSDGFHDDDNNERTSFEVNEVPRDTLETIVDYLLLDESETSPPSEDLEPEAVSRDQADVMDDDDTQDDVTQDDVTQDDVVQDDITHDDGTRDDVPLDDGTRDDVTRDDVPLYDGTRDDVTQDAVVQDDVTLDDVTQDVKVGVDNSQFLLEHEEKRRSAEVFFKPVYVDEHSPAQGEAGGVESEYKFNSSDIDLTSTDSSLMEEIAKNTSSPLPSNTFIDESPRVLHDDDEEEKPGDDSTWGAGAHETRPGEEPTLPEDPGEEVGVQVEDVQPEEVQPEEVQAVLPQVPSDDISSLYATVNKKTRKTKPYQDTVSPPAKSSELSPTVEEPSSVDSRESALSAFSETFSSLQTKQDDVNAREDRDDDLRSPDSRFDAHGVFSVDNESSFSETSGYVTPTASDDTSSKRTPSISGHEGTSTPKDDQRSQTQELTPVIVTTEAGRITPNSNRSSIVEYEEDLDVSFSKYGAGLGNRMLKDQLSMGSRESIVSYYSNAGGEVYGKYPVTGEIYFGIMYDAKIQEFQVQVHQARGIAAVDEKHNISDPYVKTYLLPDRSRGGKRKTKVQKNTINPVFDEIITYKITYDELLHRTLWLAVWNHDRFGHNDFLGEVLVTLDQYHQSGFSMEDPEPQWYDLCERQADDALMSYNGEIVLALKFVPPSSIVSKKKKKKKKGDEEKGELHINIIEATNLLAKDANGFSDPFCKSYLLPDKSKKTKEKTAVVKKTLNPKWNYQFVYDKVSHAELMDKVLELSVWDFDRGSSNEFLGGVRLGLGANLQEWDDANSDEQAAWNKMLNNQNDWNQVTLTLRDNMAGNHK